MQPRLRATLVIAAIAIASGIAGAAIDRSFLVHPPHRGPRAGGPAGAGDARRRSEMLDRMSSDLSLTPAQRTGIDSIFQRTDSTLRAIRQEAEPRVRQVLERSRTDIAARLDATQREKFLKAAAERDQKRQAGRP
jgi:Spy/CpxP family protein refolding chaperone